MLTPIHKGFICIYYIYVIHIHTHIYEKKRELFQQNLKKNSVRSYYPKKGENIWQEQQLRLKNMWICAQTAIRKLTPPEAIQLTALFRFRLSSEGSSNQCHPLTKHIMFFYSHHIIRAQRYKNSKNSVWSKAPFTSEGAGKWPWLQSYETYSSRNQKRLLLCEWVTSLPYDDYVKSLTPDLSMVWAN